MAWGQFAPGVDVGNSGSVSAGGKIGGNLQFRNPEEQPDIAGLGINLGANNAGLDDMTSALEAARKRASGETLSLAEQQLKSGQEGALRGATALGAMGRGGNIGGMQAQTQATGAGILAGTNTQAAQMRIQEQQIAEQQAASIAQAMMQQEYQNRALAQAGDLATNQQNIEWKLGLGQQAIARSGLDMEQMGQWLNFGTKMANTAGTVVQGATGSDERMKDNLRDSPGAASALVGSLPTTKEFDYKPGFETPGHKVGFSAQELERSPLGSQLVIDTPKGKYIDDGNAAILALAASAEQQKEIEELKAQLGGAPRLAQSSGYWDKNIDRRGSL
jgi:endosialidase-like protein